MFELCDARNQDDRAFWHLGCVLRCIFGVRTWRHGSEKHRVVDGSYRRASLKLNTNLESRPPAQCTLTPGALSAPRRSSRVQRDVRHFHRGRVELVGDPPQLASRPSGATPTAVVTACVSGGWAWPVGVEHGSDLGGDLEAARIERAWIGVGLALGLGVGVGVGLGLGLG